MNIYVSRHFCQKLVLLKNIIFWIFEQKFALLVLWKHKILCNQANWSLLFNFNCGWFNGYNIKRANKNKFYKQTLQFFLMNYFLYSINYKTFLVCKFANDNSPYYFFCQLFVVSKQPPNWLWQTLSVYSHFNYNIM